MNSKNPKIQKIRFLTLHKLFLFFFHLLQYEIIEPNQEELKYEFLDVKKIKINN